MGNQEGGRRKRGRIHIRGRRKRKRKRGLIYTKLGRESERRRRHWWGEKCVTHTANMRVQLLVWDWLRGVMMMMSGLLWLSLQVLLPLVTYGCCPPFYSYVVHTGGGCGCASL